MTTGQQRQMTKRQRNRAVIQPIHLQERDLDMLLSISAGRYLTVPAIEWLHYPGWRERYKAYLDHRKTDASATYYPAPKLYKRLRALREAPTPLVYRLARSVERATVVFNRLPDAYVLTEAGAELLCERRGFELDQLWYEDPRKRAIKNFEHSVAIGTFYAALRAAFQFGGQDLTDWLGDHLLASQDPQGKGPRFDRVAVVGRTKDLPVLPDATFTLAGARYFVEVDRGTTNLVSWGEKVRAYEAYRRSSKLTARYATDAFTVLIAAPTEIRMKRIAEEIVKVTRRPSSAYLFTTEDRIHPTTIRPSWKELTSVEWKRRKVVDRLVELPHQLQFTARPLWRNPEKPA
jgi:hypothetical protein